MEEITAAIAQAEQPSAAHTPDVVTTAEWQDFKQKENESKKTFRMPGARFAKPRSFDQLQSEAGYLGSLRSVAAPLTAAPKVGVPDYLSALKAA